MLPAPTGLPPQTNIKTNNSSDCFWESISHHCVCLPWLPAARPFPREAPAPLCHLHRTLHRHCSEAHTTRGLCVKDAVSCPCDPTFQGSKVAVRSHQSSRILTPGCALGRCRNNDFLSALLLLVTGDQGLAYTQQTPYGNSLGFSAPTFPRGTDMQERGWAKGPTPRHTIVNNSPGPRESHLPGPSPPLSHTCSQISHFPCWAQLSEAGPPFTYSPSHLNAITEKTN